MIYLQTLFTTIRDKIAFESKDTINLIIQENTRVENYFAVIIIKILSELKEKEEIDNFEFQKFLTGENRQHIDFYITTETFYVFIELKHIAIDSHNKKRKRLLNFYTSMADEGKKVGIVNDLQKLRKINNIQGTNLVSFAIITNPPESEVVKKRIKIIEENNGIYNWHGTFYKSEFKNIAFIQFHGISNKKPA